ncbi:MAG: type II toxin-antitoxin system RatA family toxin [Betaproteobacteria bacterium]|nr:type II toxin-antitoxin system RatA family toxin [Betaproteobacteria bacterium]
MPVVSRKVIVELPAEAMFALVDGVEAYPEFLPWCAGVEVFGRTCAETHARIDIDFHGLRSHVATRNRNEPPEWIHLALADGPFEHLAGHWHIRPLGPGGSSVEFHLEYAFTSRAMEKVLGPVFGHVVQTLVERFVERAEAVKAGGASLPARPFIPAIVPVVPVAQDVPVTPEAPATLPPVVPP